MWFLRALILCSVRTLMWHIFSVVTHMQSCTFMYRPLSSHILTGQTCKQTCCTVCKQTAEKIHSLVSWGVTGSREHEYMLARTNAHTESICKFVWEETHQWQQYTCMKWNMSVCSSATYWILPFVQTNWRTSLDSGWPLKCLKVIKINS